MESKYTIAIDAMGGDRAPAIVIDGLGKVADMLEKRGMSVLLFGQAGAIAPLMAKHPRLTRIASIIDSKDVVSGDDKPSRIIRSGRETSMWKAIEAVREDRADAVISAGNTGCFMAISKLLLKTIEGVKRPAITAMVPNVNGGRTTILDLGANAECDEENLFQFAILGSLYARLVSGIAKPRVGIMNIGSEAGKGLDYITRANVMVQANAERLGFSYVGYVEGDEIFHDKADVLVTDGFTGNMILKTIEGTAKFMKFLLKKLFRHIVAKLAYLLMFRSLRGLKDTIDTRNYNGAVLLGLNGVAVKSHGSADKKSFANAIRYAADIVAGGYTKHVKEALKALETAKELEEKNGEQQD